VSQLIYQKKLIQN